MSINRKNKTSTFIHWNSVQKLKRTVIDMYNSIDEALKCYVE